MSCAEESSCNAPQAPSRIARVGRAPCPHPGHVLGAAEVAPVVGFAVKVLRVRDERSHDDGKSSGPISCSPWLETESSFGRPRSVARCRRRSESASISLPRSRRGRGPRAGDGSSWLHLSLRGRKAEAGRGRSDWTHTRVGCGAICRASTARGPGTIRGSEPTGRSQFGHREATLTIKTTATVPPSSP